MSEVAVLGRVKGTVLQAEGLANSKSLIAKSLMFPKG